MARPDLQMRKPGIQRIDTNISEVEDAAAGIADEAEFVKKLSNFQTRQRQNRRKFELQMEKERFEAAIEEKEDRLKEEIQEQKQQLKEDTDEALRKAETEGKRIGLELSDNFQEEGFDEEKLPGTETVIARKKRQQVLNTFTENVMIDKRNQVRELADKHSANLTKFRSEVEGMKEGAFKELPTSVVAELKPAISREQKAAERKIRTNIENRNQDKAIASLNNARETRLSYMDDAAFDAGFNKEAQEGFVNDYINHINRIASKATTSFKALGKKWNEDGGGDGTITGEEARKRMQSFSRKAAVKSIRGQFEAKDTQEQKRKFVERLKKGEQVTDVPGALAGDEKTLPDVLPDKKKEVLIERFNSKIDKEMQVRDIKTSSLNTEVNDIVGRLTEPGVVPNQENLNKTWKEIKAKKQYAEKTNQKQELDQLKELEVEIEAGLNAVNSIQTSKMWFRPTLDKKIEQQKQIRQDPDATSKEKTTAKYKLRAYKERRNFLEETKNPIKIAEQSALPEGIRDIKPKDLNINGMISDVITGQNREKHIEDISRRVNNTASLTASLRQGQRKKGTKQSINQAEVDPVFLKENSIDRFKTIWQSPERTAEEKVRVFNFLNDVSENLNSSGAKQAFNKTLNKIGEGNDKFHRIMRAAENNPRFAVKAIKGQEINEKRGSEIPLEKSVVRKAVLDTMKGTLNSQFVEDTGATISSVTKFIYETGLAMTNTAQTQAEANKALGLAGEIEPGDVGEELYKDTGRKKFEKIVNKALGAEVGPNSIKGGIYESKVDNGPKIILPSNVSGKKFDRFWNLMVNRDVKDLKPNKNTASLSEVAQHTNNVSMKDVKNSGFDENKQMNEENLSNALGQITEFEGVSEDFDLIESIRADQDMQKQETNFLEGNPFRNLSHNNTNGYFNNGNKLTLEKFRKAYENDDGINLTQAPGGQGLYYLRLQDGDYIRRNKPQGRQKKTRTGQPYILDLRKLKDIDITFPKMNTEQKEKEIIRTTKPGANF